MKEKILLTGGTGFIGSHTAVELIHSGYEVIIVDDLSNSRIEVLDHIQTITGTRPDFVQLDLRDPAGTRSLFESYQFSGIIHFAARKAVGESVEKPLLYYDVNIGSLLNLLKLMKEFNVPNLVFSSSCTVYGQPEKLPVTESTPFPTARANHAKLRAGPQTHFRKPMDKRFITAQIVDDATLSLAQQLNRKDAGNSL